MAGRGRGRGGGARNAMSFNVEELGFRRGDALPVSQLTPPPLYPQLLARPAPFQITEELEYLQALKEDYRTTMSKSPHFIKADEVKNGIERYSDRFKRAAAAAANGDEEDEEERHLWEMDAKFFPVELSAPPVAKRKKTEKKPKIKKEPRKDLASRLEELEKNEGKERDEEEEEDEAVKKKKVKNPEDGDEEEEEEEEEAAAAEEDEEMGGNDYEQNYFDNGEDEANTSEDNLDEGGTF